MTQIFVEHGEKPIKLKNREILNPRAFAFFETSLSISKDTTEISVNGDSLKLIGRIPISKFHPITPERSIRHNLELTVDASSIKPNIVITEKGYVFLKDSEDYDPLKILSVTGFYPLKKYTHSFKSRFSVLRSLYTGGGRIELSEDYIKF